MGKTSKWLKGFLTGKKEKDKDREKENHKTTLRTTTTTLPSETRPPSESTPASKEKRRWSFRRSAATTAAAGKDPNSPPYVRANTQLHGLEAELDQKRHAMAVAVATAAAADAAVAAAQAAAAVFRLASEVHGGSSAMEEAAAIKIQSAFRSYLARKALCALKGLVTLQALVRGHLVRKQATATLRSMQALVTAQARARAERIRMLEEAQSANPPRHSISTLRRSPQHPRFRHSFFEEKDKLTSEENIKIVEMDRAETKSISKTSRRSSYSATITQSERKDHHRLSDYYYYYYYDPSAPPPPPPRPPPNQVSPSPSALTDVSPRACYSATSAQLDGDFFFATAQSSPQYCSAVSAPVQDVAQVKPNYMANTESWRAKARSQSAPRPRPEKRRRGGRAVGVMQRSASNISGYGYQWPPWAAPVRLDRSCASVREGSECGSTSTVLTGAGYCRSLAAFEVHGNRY